jgi:TolB protein
MREMKDRLQALDQIEAPDLRERIRSWEPRAPRTEPSLRRVGIAFLAFVVAAAGIAFAIRAFRATEPPIGPATTIENGKIAFTALTSRAAITAATWVVNPDGTGLTKLSQTPGVGGEYGPVWSPDGTKVAFYVDDPVGGSYDLYVVNADGSGLTRLTDGGGDETNPVWSPDGTRLTYVVDNPDGTSEVLIMNADGTGKTKLTNGEHDFSPAWSPDGDRIAFVRSGADYDIYSVRPDGTDLTPLTNYSGFEEMPLWSPDGSMIAFSGSQTGEDELYVANADGSGVAKLTDVPTDGRGCCIGRAAWSPDGTKIAFAVYGDGNWGIYAVNADGTAQTRLTSGPGDEVSPVWAPDGGEIAFLASPVPSSEGDNGGTFDVYTMEPEGSSVTRLTQDAQALGGGLSWQPVVVSGASPRPTPTPSESYPPSVEPVEVAQSVELKFGDLGGITSAIDGFGSLWVSLITNEGKEELLRVDPATGDVLNTSSLTSFPGHEWGGGGLAVGGGSVWVAGADAGIEQAVLSRINPATNAVAEIPLEGRAVSDVAFDVQSGRLWALVAGPARGAAQVVEIDAATGEVVSASPFEAEWYGGIFPAAGTAWVLEREVEHSTVQGGALVQILPGSAPSVATGGSFAEPVTDGTSIWAPFYGDDLAMNLANGIARIDPSTGRIVDEWKTGSIGYDVAVGEDGGIWFLGGGDLNRLNPSTGEVDVTLRVRGTPIFIVPSLDGLWVGTYEGNVVRFDVSPKA